MFEKRIKYILNIYTVYYTNNIINLTLMTIYELFLIKLEWFDVK